LPALLYAETHYRFPGFFSFLKKNEPEVIADAPHRLEPGQTLPLLILTKDAHLYPCRLVDVSIEIHQAMHTIRKTNVLGTPIGLDQKIFWKIIPLDFSEFEGWVELDVTLTIERNRNTRVYHNDNHRTSSHQPLRVFVSKDPLPRYPDLYLGDPHTHSDLTDDQVEFGVPLLPGRTLAQSLGLSFYCVTDHSYDLDDHADSYLTNDPDLKRWKEFQSAIEILNGAQNDFVIVRGEEVSCRNNAGKNVHFLLFGQKEFVHGSGDGAERWLHTKSEHSVSEVLQLRTPGSAAYAAHAKEPVPFLQRLLLGRGNWADVDLALEGMTGFQMINGRLDECFRGGYRAWTRMLLQGKRIFVIAGNDAHGNFNRFRQIGVPFITIREHADQIFGRMRTGLFVDGPLTETALLRSLVGGQAIMTDGPVARMEAANERGDSASIGGAVKGSEIELTFEAISTPEFGAINSVVVIAGRIGETSERTAFTFASNQGFEARHRVSLKQSAANYVRLEIWTSPTNSFDHRSHYCLTNPIWLDRAL